jgi:hypothetical protein
MVVEPGTGKEFEAELIDDYRLDRLRGQPVLVVRRLGFGVADDVTLPGGEVVAAGKLGLRYGGGSLDAAQYALVNGWQEASMKCWGNLALGRAGH